MKQTFNYLSSFAIIGLLFLTSCKNGDSFDPSNLNTDQAEAMVNVDQDLKKGEPTDNTQAEKGNESYCAVLETKMKSLEKDSKEMDAAYKLYKYKCKHCEDKKKEKRKIKTKRKVIKTSHQKIIALI